MEKARINIKVNNYNWCIELTDNIENLTNKEGNICKGTTSYKNKTIYLDYKISEETAKHVLIHELTHVYIYETQLELKSYYNEEDLCEFVAMYGERVIKKAKSILKAVKGELLR